MTANANTIGADQLRDIISEVVNAAISASRQPLPPTQKEVAELAEAQQYRKEQSEQVKAKMKNEDAYRQVCSHEHAQRDGGGTHCVYVQDDPSMHSMGYIYCQKCELRVRPEDPKMRKLDPPTGKCVYDTALFNRLYQDCNSQMFG